MNKNTLTVLKILRNSDIPLNRTQIFNELSPAEQGHFKGGSNGVSKLLDDLRKRYAYVENGAQGMLSTLLTWQLTDTGRKVLTRYETTKEPELMTTIDPKLTGLSSVAAEDQNHANTALISSVEESMETILGILKRALETPVYKPTPIDRKELKVDTLRRLGKMMSEDINVVFEDIIADLER